MNLTGNFYQSTENFLLHEKLYNYFVAVLLLLYSDGIWLEFDNWCLVVADCYRQIISWSTWSNSHELMVFIPNLFSIKCISKLFPSQQQSTILWHKSSSLLSLCLINISSIGGIFYVNYGDQRFFFNLISLKMT